MVVKNQEALRWVARQRRSWTEKGVIINVGMLRELHNERTLPGIQMVGAAVRKPRVPNDRLHRVTDNKFLSNAANKQINADENINFVECCILLMMTICRRCAGAFNFVTSPGGMMHAHYTASARCICYDR